MSFISINLIRELPFPIISFQIPVLHQLQLQQRIQAFIQKKITFQSRSEELNAHLCKNLFQNYHCELLAFPSRKLKFNSLSCGELYFSHLDNEKGIVMSFFPAREGACMFRPMSVRTQFQGMNYPKFDSNSVATSFFSINNITFLVCEEGTLNKGQDGQYILKGLEISILRYNNNYQTLFLRKENINLLVQNSCLIRGGNITDSHYQKYIIINCQCHIKDFSFQAKFPVLTQLELNDKIESARKVFKQNSCLRGDRKFFDVRNIEIFSNTNMLHHVVWLPPEMWIGAPYKGLQGGNLYFSYIEETEDSGSLECLIISNLFMSGDWRSCRTAHNMFIWQLENNLFFQTNPSTKKAFSCISHDIKLTQSKNSKEYSLKNARIKFISTARGIWGLCFSRENEEYLDSQSQANEVIVDTHCGQSSGSINPLHHESHKKETTCLASSQEETLSDVLPSTKKKASQKTQKRSAECLEIQPHLLNYFWNSECDLEVSTSQDAKKKSAACWKSKFTEQDPFWSSTFGSKKKSTKDGQKKLNSVPFPYCWRLQPEATVSVPPSSSSFMQESESVQMPLQPFSASMFKCSEEKTSFQLTPDQSSLLSSVSSKQYLQQRVSSIDSSGSLQPEETVSVLPSSSSLVQVSESDQTPLQPLSASMVRPPRENSPSESWVEALTAEDWHQLNIALQHVSQETLQNMLKDAKNTEDSQG